MVDADVLLKDLKYRKQSVPDLEQYIPTSREHLVWIQSAHTRLSHWNQYQAA